MFEHELGKFRFTSLAEEIKRARQVDQVLELELLTVLTSGVLGAFGVPIPCVVRLAHLDDPRVFPLVPLLRAL